MQVRVRRTPFLFLAALALVANGLFLPTAVRAAVPTTMSYQGVLTDGAGNPVADGAYKLGFTLYDAPTGGTALWNEIQPNIPVSKGSFSVLLGTTIPLTLAFDQPYWLGVAVNSGPELTPRIALASSPYALSLRVPFRATSNDSTPTLWAVNPSGYDALRVSSSFKIYPNGANPAIQQIYDPTGNPSLQLLAGGNSYDTSLLITNPSTGAIPAYLGTAAGHPGTNFGNLLVGGLNNSRFLKVDGYNGGTGDPKLSIQSGVSNIVLDSHQSGDAAVQLPAGSIGPSEMWGLPGISQAHLSTLITLNTAQPTDMETTTVYVPTAGFVVLEGTAQLRLDSQAGDANYILYQVDDNPTLAMDASDVVVGIGSSPNTATTFHSAYVTRTYFKSPGAYTFHFKAQRAGTGFSLAYVYNPTLRATFYPSANGIVQTFALAPEAAQFEHATPVAPVTMSAPGLPQGASSGAGSIVDLRELQLRAARADADAARAHSAVLEAEAARDHAEILSRNTPPAARTTAAVGAR